MGKQNVERFVILAITRNNGDGSQSISPKDYIDNLDTSELILLYSAYKCSCLSELVKKQSIIKFSDDIVGQCEKLATSRIKFDLSSSNLDKSDLRASILQEVTEWSSDLKKTMFDLAVALIYRDSMSSCQIMTDFLYSQYSQVLYGNITILDELTARYIQTVLQMFNKNV